MKPARRLTPAGLAVKRLFDIVGAAFLVVVLSPVLLIVGLAILVTSGTPVLFCQERAGFLGKPFTLYKFRTMVGGAEDRLSGLAGRSDVQGPVFKMWRDPRVTRLGLILRLFSADELPQLFNVLKGEMSLVGPRPALPAEVAEYEGWQRRRLSVKPGMTCTWQASGRSAIPFNRWVQMDLSYIDAWSPFLDIEILVRTIPAVLFARGAW